MSVVVVATIKPLPEYREDVIAAFTAIIPQVHDEDGCELYTLNAAEDRPQLRKRNYEATSTSA